MNDKFLWLENVKNILDNCGLSNIWQTQDFPNEKWLVTKVKQTLIDQFRQNWLSKIQDSPKALNYRIYKDKLEFENYFHFLSDKDALTLCRFRTCNHYLPIEKGRWANTPRDQRKCRLCQTDGLGDEFHYLLECPALQIERRLMLPNYTVRHPNIIKFNKIMTCRKQSVVKKLCVFIRIIFKKNPR